MTTISIPAVSARESARRSVGRFGEQGRLDPGQLAPADGAIEAAVPVRDWGSVDIREGSHSKWGLVQEAIQRAPGIATTTTGSHGGIKLSPEPNAAIPAPLRTADGCYEEDAEEWPERPLTGDNDHIDIVVQMVREDGTWASSFRSQQRSQDAHRAIEKTYGFTPVGQVAAQRDAQAYSMVDAQRNATIDQGGKRVLAETDVEKLRRLMLGAATQAPSEAGYVQALWRAGVVTPPRYAAGTTDVVVGYSVTLRPQGDKAPFWQAAGRVHKSLTLPNVRSQYVDTPEAAVEAAATWGSYTGATPAPTRQRVKGREREALTGVGAVQAPPARAADRAASRVFPRRPGAGQDR